MQLQICDAVNRHQNMWLEIYDCIHQCYISGLFVSDNTTCFQMFHFLNYVCVIE